MNIGQAFGELNLRIAELEEGAPADTDAVRQLRAENAQAKASETAALIRLGKEREARVQAESKLTSAFERIAKLEVRTSIRGDDGALKAVNADLEARLRGRDQQLAELHRKLDDALTSGNLQAARIRELEHRPPEVIEKPMPADCQVCKAIKLMVLGVEPKPSSSLPTLPPVVPRPSVSNQTTPGAVRGIARAIRDTLATAEHPMSSHEIADRAGVTAVKVGTNITHLVHRGELVRLGPKANGVPGGGYRYWLASRPMPEGAPS